MIGNIFRVKVKKYLFADEKAVESKKRLAIEIVQFIENFLETFIPSQSLQKSSAVNAEMQFINELRGDHVLLINNANELRDINDQAQSNNREFLLNNLHDNHLSLIEYQLTNTLSNFCM
ncbi:hypothetical protein LOAG_09576 [Loa loa]|uniref:Uncharacterized protein n=1 Tax=Loa loa TaxID=7209 RepID=A0A1S0TS68_LOALO|nr:hypothetical protein LOAG_09576 [Loa loa]EFO18919.1 hypothetical protein LOAG_09576 [Loa loa]